MRTVMQSRTYVEMRKPAVGRLRARRRLRMAALLVSIASTSCIHAASATLERPEVTLERPEVSRFALQLGCEEGISSAKLSPDRNIVATACRNDSTVLWDRRSEKVLAHLPGSGSLLFEINRPFSHRARRKVHQTLGPSE